MAGERRYQCVFCAKTIASGGLDVSALVLILKWDQPEAVQRTQQFWCHADCFRSRVHESVPLLRGQEFVDTHEVIGRDCLSEPTGVLERLDLLFKFCPACKSVLSGDLKLCIEKRGSGAGPNEVLSLIAKMA